jgi:hypothetical protein
MTRDEHTGKATKSAVPRKKTKALLGEFGEEEEKMRKMKRRRKRM